MPKAEGTIEKRKPETVLSILREASSFAQEMKRALPRWITADRMLRVVLTEFRKTPALLSCTLASVQSAVMQTAQLGLEPGGALGHAWFIPFKDECTLVIGYKGLIDLARRSGQIVNISARVVYERDEFRYTYGLDETLEHIPADEDRGEPRYVYGVANLTGGGHSFEVMSLAEVNAIRNRSRAYQRAEGKAKDSTWHLHWGEMARKTLVRRLFKYLPASVIPREAHDVLNREDETHYRMGGVAGPAVAAEDLLSPGRHALAPPRAGALPAPAEGELDKERAALVADAKKFGASTAEMDTALAGRKVEALTLGELRGLRTAFKWKHEAKAEAKKSAKGKGGK